MFIYNAIIYTKKWIVEIITRINKNYSKKTIIKNKQKKEKREKNRWKNKIFLKNLILYY